MSVEASDETLAPSVADSLQAGVLSWWAIATAAWDAPGWTEAAIEYRQSYQLVIHPAEPEPDHHPSWYCETCNSQPCVNPSFCRACRAADRRVAARSKIAVLNTREAPGATVEALMFSLRSGVDALREPSTLRRLARLSKAQAREVAERVRRFKPNIARAWDLDAVEALLKIWSLRHGR
jgi:hypothetical protein